MVVRNYFPQLIKHDECSGRQYSKNNQNVTEIVMVDLYVGVFDNNVTTSKGDKNLTKTIVHMFLLSKIKIPMF